MHRIGTSLSASVRFTHTDNQHGGSGKPWSQTSAERDHFHTNVCVSKMELKTKAVPY